MCVCVFIVQDLLPNIVCSGLDSLSSRAQTWCLCHVSISHQASFLPKRASAVRFLGAMPIRPVSEVCIGDQIRITGPVINGRGTWRPDRPFGWQPQAYTAPPGSSPSYRIGPDDLIIDFTRRFTVLAVCHGRLFVTVLVHVPDGNSLRSVWINVGRSDVGRSGENWAVILREYSGERHQQ